MWWESFAASVSADERAPAIVAGGLKRTRGELLADVCEIARARMPAPGAAGARRVVVASRDPLFVLLHVLAAWRAGLVPVVLHADTPKRRIQAIARPMSPLAWFGEEGAAGGASPGGRPPDSVDPDPRAEALMISTSGTTGLPRVVALPHESVAINARTISEALAFGPGDAILVSLPMSHGLSLVGGALAGLVAGATLHMFDAATPPPILMAHVRAAGITVVQAPPSQHRLQLAWWNGAPFESVRRVVIGGETTGRPLLDRLRAAYPHAETTAIYGMAEAGPRVSHIPGDDPRVEKGAVGRPFAHWDWEIRPFDGAPAGAGLLALRGPALMLGFVGADGRATGVEEDGSYPTADLVSAGDDDVLTFHGRSDGIFKVGGRTVNPTAVERSLSTLPGVAAVRCRPVPHEILGFRVSVDVVADPRAPVDEDAIRKFCRAELDAPSVPSEVRFVEEIPIGSTGKLARA